MPLIHIHIHTPTAIGCHARYQPARQEQLGVGCLAQGHFDTPRVGSNWQPFDCQTTALPPEPYRTHGQEVQLFFRINARMGNKCDLSDCGMSVGAR